MNSWVLLVLFFLTGLETNLFGQVTAADSCDASTPKFVFNLSGNPDSVWKSTRIRRSGLCCQLDPNASPPLRCVQFFFKLDTGAAGIIFDIATGAKPPGALGYSTNCGDMHTVGDPICLSGDGPFWLTFCKPGFNPNTYSITSFPKPRVSPPIAVSDGCTGKLTAYGFVLSTIVWSSVPNNPLHNSYLTCTKACATTTAVYKKGAPAYIDYQVQGKPIGGCAGDLVTRYTRVYFFDNKKAQITPVKPTICFGNNKTTITGNITGGMAPFTYKWNTGQTTQSINVGVGKYWVDIQDNSSCPPTSDTVVVTAFTKPIRVNAGNDTIVCLGDSLVKLHGTFQSATGAKWFGGSGTFSPNDSTMEATYTLSSLEKRSKSFQLHLRSTGNGTCPGAVDSVLIQVVPPTVVNTTDKLICIGANTQLEASLVNGGSYIWTSHGKILANTNILNAKNIKHDTSYVVTLTDKNKCKSHDTAYVKTFPPPKLALKDVQECEGESVLLVGIPTNNVNMPVLEYLWYHDNKLLLKNDSLVTKLPGQYILVVQAGECSVRDTAQIKLFPHKALAGADTAICRYAQFVNLRGTVTPADAGGYWKGGSGIFEPDHTSLVTKYYPTAQEKKSFFMKLILTTNKVGNCTPNADTMVVRFLDIPVFTVPNDTLCIGSSKLLSTPLYPLSKYEWMHNGQVVAKTNKLQLTDLQKNDFYQLTVTNANNCVNTDTIAITIFPAPLIKLTKTLACTGSSIVLRGKPYNISGFNKAPGRYSWYRDNNLMSSQADSLVIKESGLYKVIFAAGNCMGKDTTKVHFEAAPTVDLPEWLKFCKETDPMLTLDGGPDHLKYLWHPTGKTTQKIEVNEAGIYKLTVSNEHLCTAIDSVEVREICPPRLYVPTIFTPDQDKNNHFVISGAHVKTFNLTIFNRWGEIIYYTEDRIQSWDGNYHGKPMPNGVYAWLVVYEGFSTEFKGPFTLQGSVTLVR